MTKIAYYIDFEKVEQKQASGEYGTISITPPAIKNSGVFSDAGIDLFAQYDFTVTAGSMRIVETFTGIYMPLGVAGLIWPRGGDNFLVGAGVIDTGYTGTIKVKIINPYAEDMSFKAGDSVGQLVMFVKGVTSDPELHEVPKGSAHSEAARQESGRIVDQWLANE